ncbi:MAG: SPOR domain-containing protein [Bacteroidota bacterium]
MGIRFKYYLIGLSFLVQCLSTMAQKTDTLGLRGNVMEDPRVEILIRKHIQIYQTLKTIDGFRIQLFSDSGNNSKMNAQAVYDEFILKHPRIGAYLTFKSPNYKVRIGDFRTKLDAQRFLNELATDYPNAFIVAESINLPQVE